MKLCIACGMPMETPLDYPNEDTTKDYCKHCAHPDGSMQTFKEKQLNLIHFITDSQGLDESVAKEAAKTMMKDLPAWKSYFN